MSSIYEQYETVIGLEVHIQLSTASKAFCADANQFGGAPNTQVSTISLGHPGTLPRLNKKQIEYAVRLGLALDSRINPRSRFDRKNYFYADLPKGYQITQDAQPICIGGQLKVETDAGARTIRIHHIHMEEDAGKSIHDGYDHFTMVDLNRAGVPLLELVTEPDFRSAAEVDAFMTAMRQLVRYLEISDGNMEEGSMRCDCNISVRKKGATTFGNRCEVKNVNSMKFARQAITYEVKRQVDLIENGGEVLQQTLNFDPATGKTSPLRSKEDAHDYRYFPDPDLPPVALTEDYIDRVKASQPPLPWTLKARFQNDYQLSEYDARLLTENKADALAFQYACEHSPHHKLLANLFINKIKPYQKDHPEATFATRQVGQFVQLIADNKVSPAIANQRLFPEMALRPDADVAQLAEELHLIQSDDTDFLDGLITEVMKQFPDKVKAYRNGKKNLLGLFMGEVMKKAKGKAEPKTLNVRLRERLVE